MRLLKQGKIGEPKIFSSVFAFQVADNNIRLSSRFGGGALYDIGIYAINASRYLFQDEPTSVIAQVPTREDRRFKEVEGTYSAIMQREQSIVLFGSEKTLNQLAASLGLTIVDIGQHDEEAPPLAANG